MRKSLGWGPLLVVYGLSTGCSSSQVTATDQTVVAASMAVEAVDDAGNASNTARDPHSSTPAGIANALMTSCFTLTTNGNAQTGTNTYTFTDCPLSGARHQSGTLEVTVTQNPNGRLIAVTSNLTRTFANGDTLTIAPLDPNQPSATLTLDYSANPDVVDGTTLTGALTVQEHRVRKDDNNNPLFDLDVTIADLTLVDTFASDALSQRVINGTALVAHHLAHFTANQTFAALTRTAACCYPTSGTVDQNLSYTDHAATFDRIYTYTSTCGTVTYDTTAVTGGAAASGTGSYTLDPC